MTQFDAHSFDPPVRKRAVTQKPKQLITHRVWAYTPHTGAELILDTLRETYPLEHKSDLYLFAEGDEWFAHGGDLYLHMGEICAANNAQAQMLLSRAQDIQWVGESKLQRHREIALVEMCTGELYSRSISGLVQLDQHREIDEALNHCWAWKHIIEQWRSRWPGTVHDVSDYFTEKTWPYPHQLQFSDHSGQKNRIFSGAAMTQLLASRDIEHRMEVDARWLAGYFTKLPLAHTHE